MVFYISQRPTGKPQNVHKVVGKRLAQIIQHIVTQKIDVEIYIVTD